MSLKARMIKLFSLGKSKNTPMTTSTPDTLSGACYQSRLLLIRPLVGRLGPVRRMTNFILLLALLLLLQDLLVEALSSSHG